MSTPEQLSTVAIEAQGRDQRKYAVEETSGRPTLFASVALTIAATLGYLKDLLYRGGARKEGDPSGLSSDTDGRKVAGYDDTAVEASAATDDERAPSPQPASAPTASSTGIAISASAYQAPMAVRGPTFFAVEPARVMAGGPQSPLAANDNSASTAGRNVVPANTSGTAPSNSSTAGEEPVAKSKAAPTKSKTDLVTDDKRANHAPSVAGEVRFENLTFGHALVFALSDLLAHASDADGDRLFVTDVTASSGELVQLAPDAWQFTAESGDTTDVVFSYSVSDGTDATAATALLSLVEPVGLPIPADVDGPTYGTQYNDVIVGGNSGHIIFAETGNDLIRVGDGANVIFGGDGDDLIYAGAGDDVIVAGAGNDTVFAGAGNDIVHGGGGDDTVFGEDGNDTLLGDAGNDALFGGNGDDVVYGGDGDDTIDLGSGDDVGTGGSGNDAVLGRDGDDTFLATAGDGDDLYDGGAGNDTYVATAAGSGIIVDLGAGTSSGADTGHDALVGIENVVGTTAADVIVGDAADNSLEGGEGDDIVTGGGGSDAVLGGDGDDIFIAAAATAQSPGMLDDGDDFIDGGGGTDTYDASAATQSVTIDLALGKARGLEIGTDTLVELENAVGGHGDDWIVANDAKNVLTGGQGNDTFVMTLPADTRAEREQWDEITDFSPGDRIDVTGIDADENESGHQEFEFLGLVSEFTRAGQIRYSIERDDDDASEHTIVRFTVHDAAHEDLVLDLHGMLQLTVSDFHGAH
ncbi:MAG: cadherin-like domain-containing protein [Hyphomicrobiaceae bacterium]